MQRPNNRPQVQVGWACIPATGCGHYRFYRRRAMRRILAVLLVATGMAWLSPAASAHERAWLGICVLGLPGSFHTVSVALNENEIARGLRIASVAGPAAVAGVQITDLLVEVDGLPG